MWKIEIKSELNPDSEYAGKWFNGFDESNQPKFKDNKEDANSYTDIKELYQNVIKLYREFSLECSW
jgi:hypothetical protein